MDQTSQQAAQSDDFYAKYVEERRERVAAEETTIPAVVTCHIEMAAEDADALLDLIAQNQARYGIKSQAYLRRASIALEGGIRAAAEAYARSQGR